MASGRSLLDRDGHRAARGDAESRPRSEEHTSELQSRQYLVCRLLLEKKICTYLYYLLQFCNFTFALTRSSHLYCLFLPSSCYFCRRLSFSPSCLLSVASLLFSLLLIF